MVQALSSVEQLEKKSWGSCTPFALRAGLATEGFSSWESRALNPGVPLALTQPSLCKSWEDFWAAW